MRAHVTPGPWALGWGWPAHGTGPFQGPPTLRRGMRWPCQLSWRAYQHGSPWRWRPAPAWALAPGSCGGGGRCSGFPQAPSPEPSYLCPLATCLCRGRPRPAPLELKVHFRVSGTRLPCHKAMPRATSGEACLQGAVCAGSSVLFTKSDASEAVKWGGRAVGPLPAWPTGPPVVPCLCHRPEARAPPTAPSFLRGSGPAVHSQGGP